MNQFESKRGQTRWSRIAVALVPVLLGVLLLGTLPAWAELVISQATLSGGPPVVVNKSNGATLRGTVSDCTPELLFVLPTPKPIFQNGKMTPAPPATQPVEVPWKEIRTVSNGLSPRIALDIWMAAHATELCPSCHGERTVRCPVCKGTRHDPASATTCPTCRGELLVACRTAGEVKGQIRCPNSCLKFGVGRWVKQPDGLMWRVWVFGNDTQSFSTRHLGHVMSTDRKAMPPISDLGECPVCGGTTLVDDPLCFGTGQLPCPTCLARVSAPPCPNHCDKGRVVCPTCGGTGLKKAE